MELREWPLPEVRIGCIKCNRETTYSRDGLAALFGDDVHLLGMLMDLSAGCDPGVNEVCKQKYLDGLLVEAILEDDESQVLEPSLLPQAREWRERLGIRRETDDLGQQDTVPPCDGSDAEVPVEHLHGGRDLAA